MSDTNPILTSVESLQIEDSTSAIINPATAENQYTIIGNLTPLATNTTSQVTLTSANTAYILPASQMTSRRTIIIYNPTIYDVFIGGATVTISNGILLASGATISIDSVSGLYGVSPTASVTLNILELK